MHMFAMSVLNKVYTFGSMIRNSWCLKYLLSQGFVNYYQVLKIGSKASQEEVKSAYKSLAKQYHPDLNQGF